VPIIYKDTKAYNYSYADMPAIIKIINPLLSKYGLGFTQPIVGITLETILFHIESGETISSSIEIRYDIELKGQNSFQTLGSQITYLRRYALSSLLGLVTDKDTDAQGTQTRKPKAASKLPKLNYGDNAWVGVVTALKGSYTMADIRKKYDVSAEVETQLLMEV
jgi:hypothetical protein